MLERWRVSLLQSFPVLDQKSSLNFSFCLCTHTHTHFPRHADHLISFLNWWSERWRHGPVGFTIPSPTDPCRGLKLDTAAVNFLKYGPVALKICFLHSPLKWRRKLLNGVILSRSSPGRKLTPVHDSTLRTYKIYWIISETLKTSPEITEIISFWLSSVWNCLMPLSARQPSRSAQHGAETDRKIKEEQKMRMESDKDKPKKENAV